MTYNFNLDERLNEIQSLVTQAVLSHKKALTVEEAAIYTGRSTSDLYHLTSTRVIPFSKPKGKMIYFDREELEEWMLSKPVRTATQIDAEVATYVALTTPKAGQRRAGKNAK